MHIAESGSEFHIEFVATFEPDTAFLARYRSEPKLENFVYFCVYLLHPARHFIGLC